MANFAQRPTVIVGSTTDTGTTALHPVGTRAFDAAGNEYIYVKAGSAIAQFDAVTFSAGDTDFSNVISTSAVQQYVLGAAQVAIANGSYGWILHRGLGRVKATDAIAEGAFAFSSATGGLLTVNVADTSGATHSTSSRVAVVDTHANADTSGALCIFS